MDASDVWWLLFWCSSALAVYAVAAAIAEVTVR